MNPDTLRLHFVCVGPQRTASSWLDRALRSHPGIALPAHVKETFYFDRYYDRGLNWYASFFDYASADQVCGEVGSTYFESKRAVQRIQSHSADARIIVMVRNPLSRTFSSFRHEYSKGRAREDFFAAIREQPRIVGAGRYAALCAEWEAVYGREGVLYVVQEDIEADPQGQIDRVFRFLGVEPVPLPEELLQRYGQATVPRFRWLAAAASRTASSLRSAGWHRLVEAGKALGLKRVYGGGVPSKLAMTRPVFEFLLEEHSEDIDYLEKRLGRSFTHWRDPAMYDLQDEA